VGEEGEPAEDDPGAEQASGDGEDQELGEATLDKREFEGLEHPRDLNENESNLNLDLLIRDSYGAPTVH
jgi:hypothetical protein